MKQPTGPRYKPPIPAIRLGATDRPDIETRYATLLVWYMRALGLLWMGQGVAIWYGLLLDGGGPTDILDTVPYLAGAALIFFCVLDVIAAVGLWLATSWGGVVWLVAVSAQWLTAITLPALLPSDRLIGALDLLLVAGYFVLTYRAAQESEPYV